MKAFETVTSRYFYPDGNPYFRLFALGYFALLITAWTFLGHTVLGFEQSFAQPVVGVVSACFAQWLLEWVDAWSKQRPPRYRGGFWPLVNFLLPAWIPGLAVAMLLYPNERLWPIAFAASLSIASKVLFRAPIHGASQHVFNPSNFGITTTLLLFPWIGLAPPYHFTENVSGVWDWAIPGAILASGIFLHALCTGRLPLCLAWLGGFLLQAAIRCALFDIPWQVPLVPMTSAAFILFTLYMIPDPATTPLNPYRQVWFGLAVAAVYGLLQALHVVFGLFIALFLVCALRGAGLYVRFYYQRWTNLKAAEVGAK
ncbi:hypothetical protein JCM13664_17930 [Methylothermus subterraneus]